MPCSTASRSGPPARRILRAASLEALPKGQVETTRGFSGVGSARVSRTEEMAAAPMTPMVAPLTKLRLDTLIEMGRDGGAVGGRIETRSRRKEGFFCGKEQERKK